MKISVLGAQLLHADRLTKLVVAFRNFANPPKNWCFSCRHNPLAHAVTLFQRYSTKHQKVLFFVFHYTIITSYYYRQAMPQLHERHAYLYQSSMLLGSHTQTWHYHSQQLGDKVKMKWTAICNVGIHCCTNVLLSLLLDKATSSARQMLNAMLLKSFFRWNNTVLSEQSYQCHSHISLMTKHQIRQHEIPIKWALQVRFLQFRKMSHIFLR